MMRASVAAFAVENSARGVIPMPMVVSIHVPGEPVAFARSGGHGTELRTVRVHGQKASDAEIWNAYCELRNVWRVGERLGMCGQTVQERLKKLNYTPNIDPPITDAERDHIRKDYAETPTATFNLSISRSSIAHCRDGYSRERRHERAPFHSSQQRIGVRVMTSMHQKLHAEHKARMGRLAVAGMLRGPPIALPPPEEPPVPEPVRQPPPSIEDMPKHPSWFWIVNAIPKTHPSIKDIQRAVAAHYNIDLIDILSQRRAANIVRPRQVAMYLAKMLTLRSLPEIGRRFGGRDHTTALHAVRKIGALCEQDAELSAAIAIVTGMLKPTAPPDAQMETAA